MAGNKKHRQYHRPPVQKVSIQKPIRLSQCMIVKNEEKNIERALSWAKEIAFEQIVVDTGSTDRTVEIAESMGAKIYHFEWVNDFSAAKNYAIEQATGDWIAFLDADEYLSDADAKKLIIILRKIEADPQYRKIKTAITCPWAQLDDDGKPFLVLTQNRIFRNTPEIRYKGSIHEGLVLSEPCFDVPELSIIHTGYTKSAYADTGKAGRNIDLIREELKNKPEDANLKCYLADSLGVTGELQNLVEAEILYRDALASGQVMLSELKQRAYNYLITAYYDKEERNSENIELCRRAYEEFPENPDFCYYYGRKLHIEGNYLAAWEKLAACENLLKRDRVELSGYIISHALMLFFQMVLTAEELGKMPEVIRCATLVLKEDKYQYLILAPYLQAFKREGYETSDDEIYTLLGKIYDFNNLKDKLTVLRAAKEACNTELVGKILLTFNSEELAWLTSDPE